MMFARTTFSSFVAVTGERRASGGGGSVRAAGTGERFGKCETRPSSELNRAEKPKPTLAARDVQTFNILTFGIHFL